MTTWCQSITTRRLSLEVAGGKSVACGEAPASRGVNAGGEQVAGRGRWAAGPGGRVLWRCGGGNREHGTDDLQVCGVGPSQGPMR